LLFVSVVLFFISFFWAFFPRRLSPTIELGPTWPSAGIQHSASSLLNTAILLASVVDVTWAHHSLLENNATQATWWIFFAVLQEIYFITLQAYKYSEAPFTIADSAYRSSFFRATGFHRLHVIVGTTFLITCILWQTTLHFSSNHDFEFKAAVWYWHLVDIVLIQIHLNLLIREMIFT
jgi:Heme/copper-type cytochrome/quinol oxidase, subunit 3